MARYYNPGRTAISISLPGGRAASVPGKESILIDPEDEGSEALQRQVALGHLTRLPDQAPPEPSMPAAPVTAMRFPTDHVVRPPAPVSAAPKLNPPVAPVAPVAPPPAAPKPVESPAEPKSTT